MDHTPHAGAPLLDVSLLIRKGKNGFPFLKEYDILLSCLPKNRLKMDAGVYKITNFINGESYIGSSANLFRRWSEHRNLLLRGRHENHRLQKDWNSFSEHAFVFCVVLVCKKDDLHFYEQRCIDVMKPFYNLRRDVRSTKYISFNGESLTIQEWAERLGISKTCIVDRIKVKNLSIEDALTLPSAKGRSPKLYEYGGEMLPLSEISARTDTPYNTLWRRASRGEDIDEIISGRKRRKHRFLGMTKTAEEWAAFFGVTVRRINQVVNIDGVKDGFRKLYRQRSGSL